MSQWWAFVSGITGFMFIDALWFLPDMRVRGEISVSQETVIILIYFAIVLYCGIKWVLSNNR